MTELWDRLVHGFSNFWNHTLHDSFCVCGMYEPLDEVEDDEDFNGPYSI